MALECVFAHTYAPFSTQQKQSKVFSPILAFSAGLFSPVYTNAFSHENAYFLIRFPPLHDPVTWYRINYAGTQVTQWDFQNRGTRTSPAQLSFVLKVPLCNLRPSIINSVPCDRIVQRAYSCDNDRNRRPHGCSMQLFVVFTVVLKVSRCKAKVQ